VGGSVPDQDAAGLEGNVHPFVQVQRNGIGAFHTVQLIADIVRQHRYCTDCAIHMEPELFPLAEISDGIQIIDCAGVDGAGCGDDAKRQHTRCAVFCDLSFKRLEIDGVVGVYRDMAHPIRAQSQSFDCFLIAAVHLG